MIKKYLLNTTVAMVFLSSWSVHHVYSMDDMRMASDAAIINPYDRVLGDVPRTQPVGGVMVPTRSRLKLLTENELASNHYKSEGAPCFPLFSGADPSWKTLSYARLKEIVDDQGSSDSARRSAFNRLSFAVETITKHIYRPVVKDGENVSELVFNSRSVEENEAIVSVVRLLAKVTLWDSAMEPDNLTRFNPILDAILHHNETRGAEICAPYSYYLFKIEKFLDDAINIQDFLMGAHPSQQHRANDTVVINPYKRIKGVLLADRARVFELRLLKRKVQMRLDLRDAGSNEIVDRDGILRGKAYTFYHDALSQGASKSCLLGMIKLINDNGYSPTGDMGGDREILLELLERYTKHLGEQKRSPRGVFAQFEKVHGSKIVGAIPKPRNAIDYISALKDKLQLVGEASSGQVLSYDDSFMAGVEPEIDLTIGEVIPAFNAEGNSSAARIVTASNRALTIDTHLGASTDSMPSRSSAKSKHLSPAKQEEIRVFFGSKEGALERYGSYESAYRDIAQHFGVTKSQVAYAIYGQQKYKESRALMQAASDQSSHEAVESDQFAQNLSNDSDTDEEWNPFFKRRRKMSHNSFLVSDDEA